LTTHYEDRSSFPWGASSNEAEGEDELWAGGKARYNSTTEVEELTRDDTKWKEIINELDARGRKCTNMKASKKKASDQ